MQNPSITNPFSSTFRLISTVAKLLLLHLWGLSPFLETTTLLAQTSPHPAFRQYTTDDGLASSETYCIIQDKQGYIWISSDNGVSRFDGYQFRNYGLKDGLKENVIFEMHLDTLGRLWMQAMGGNLYYLDGETIRPYWNNGVLQNFKNRPDVGKGFIVEGAGETVHIATLTYGVISISKAGGTTIYPHPEPSFRQVFERKGQAINAAFNHLDAEVQKAYQEKLRQQNRISPVYFHTSKGLRAFPDLYYSNIENVQKVETFRLGEEKYLCQTYDDVWFIQNGQIRWRYHFPYDILHARLMQDGQLFVGLHRYQGLWVYPSVEAFRQGRGENWLPGQSVSYFMEDRAGGRWFTTNESGVFYAPANAFLIHDQKTGLPDEKVTALTLKNEKEVYVGLGNGEIWSRQPKSEKWMKLTSIPGKGSIRDLYFDHQAQRLWAGRDNLVYLQQNKWIEYSATLEREKSITTANRITTSPTGERLWLSNHMGFMSIEFPQMKLANLQMGHGQRTYVVREDFMRRVWVGRPEGLFELKDGILLERQNLHPAFALRVEDIVLLPDSTLAVATKGGGIVFWKNGKHEQLTTAQGLCADMLECVYADEKGVVWAGTLNGLNRISGSWGKRKVEAITVAHGLPSNEISRITSSGENVWVATSKGLVHFSKKPINHFSPRPILASVLANNQPLDLSKPLALLWNKNNLEINFFAINFKMNGKIPYRYRMDGGAWAQTLNGSLNFPALPPGQRFFEVQAQNEDGIWSAPTSLRLAIHPPWWDTWWFRIGTIVVALSMLFFVYKYRIGRLKKQNQIQQQITELERAALQAQMNPHFIFNCLNSIQNYILQNEKESAILYLGRFAGLVRSVLNASVAGKIRLEDELNLLNNYLALEKLRFKDRFTYEVKTADGFNVFELSIPPLLVQPYVENALLHGMSGKTSGGKVSVLFKKIANYLEVSIQDNGTGFNGESGPGKNAKKHKSFGMSITSNRLKLLADKKENEAVHTRSILDEHGQVCGTKVTILIGLGTEFFES
ncbi:histidine kinase [Haliscomenobacter sp.]|uniref:sensor histidine kinase n=1 Tax=Haliscomenobacter sp. TaxID=2717303 RepID=UPI003364FAD0